MGDLGLQKICLVTDSKQRLYYTGFSSTDGYVMLIGDRKIFVVDSRYYSAAAKRLAPRGIEVVLGTDYSPLQSLAEEIGTNTVGVDYSVTAAAELEVLHALGFETVDVGEVFARDMEIKSQRELNLIKKACNIAEKSFGEAIKLIRAGMTERELAAELEYRFRMNGASDKSFDTIVAFGANSAVPHHETGERRLKENEPVLMDFGCIYRGYCSDMTRTFWFGDRPSKQFVDAYRAVYGAHMAAYENERAGMTGVEADKIARDHLVELGYGKYFTHSLGHGIGVNIHEAPWVSFNARRSAAPLRDGMVCSIEPGIYLDGKFGIRIEDSVAIEDGRPKSFMRRTKALCVWKDGKLVRYNGKGVK